MRARSGLLVIACIAMVMLCGTPPARASQASGPTPTPETIAAASSLHWWEILGLVGSGGVIGTGVIELLKWLLTARTERVKERRTARELVAKHLEPILRSAEELVSRINALARSDFAEFEPARRAAADLPQSVETTSLHYHVAHFWAQLEFLAQRSVSVNLAEDPDGDKLIGFIRCLDAPGVQLIDRHLRRCLVELVTRTTNSIASCIPLSEFTASLREATPVREWFECLSPPDTARGRHAWRQRVLVYGLVVLALMRELDPHHRVTRPHRVHYNKMSSQTISLVRSLVFRRHLSFVSNPGAYIPDAPT